MHTPVVIENLERVAGGQSRPFNKTICLLNTAPSIGLKAAAKLCFIYIHSIVKNNRSGAVTFSFLRRPCIT